MQQHVNDLLNKEPLNHPRSIFVPIQHINYYYSFFFFSLIFRFSVPCVHIFFFIFQKKVKKVKIVTFFFEKAKK